MLSEAGAVRKFLNDGRDGGRVLTRALIKGNGGKGRRAADKDVWEMSLDGEISGDIGGRGFA